MYIVRVRSSGNKIIKNCHYILITSHGEADLFSTIFSTKLRNTMTYENDQ
jgi:hypothetical protein